MKILFVSHYASLYGANKSLLNLIDGLQSINTDLDISIILPDGDFVNELKKREIQIFKVPFFNEVNLVESKCFRIKGLIKLLINFSISIFFFFRFRKAHFDVIHTNSSVTFIGAYLAFLLKKKHIWHIREFGKEDYNLVYSLGDSYFRFWLKKSTGVIAISNSIATKRINFSAPRKTIISNGIIYEKEIKLEQKSVSKMIVFGVVGLLAESKNQLEALKAFKLFLNKYSNSKLLIVGDGVDKGYKLELLTFVKESRMEKCVVFTGYQSDVNRFYHQIDILLMCSRNEALGRVTIEAMSQGIAVIGFDNGGTSEILENGLDGLLYTGDHVDLYKRMLDLYENKVLKERIILNAIDKVQKQYTIEIYTRNVMSFYRECGI